MANFKPDQNEYKNLTPFKMWLVNQINTWGCSNFPFLESDFDKLTNYAMMMKLMKAINNVIANENKVEEDMTNLFNAFTELQNYVNTYFDNLDVQDAINHKLDEMAESGELTNLIKNYVDPIYQAYENNINTEINTQNLKIQALESGSPLVATSTSDMTDTTRIYVNTTDGYWYYYNGTSWAAGGVYQATTMTDYIEDGVEIAYDFPQVDNDEWTSSVMSLSRASINISTGAITGDQGGKRIRTGRLATSGNAMRGYIATMESNDYLIAPRWYTNNTSQAWEDAYIEGRDWGKKFFMGLHPYCAFIVKRADDGVISDDELTTIKENIHFYFITDKTLTKENIPADSKAVGDAISNLNTYQTLNATFSMYNKFGVCGASWDSGYFYPTSQSEVAVERGDLSWGANVARRNGNTFYDFSRHSMNTRDYLTNSHCLPKVLSSDVCDLYILGLGGNDSTYLGMDYLGTIADITNDYTQNPDTFYGNYARIIEQIQNYAPNSKIIMAMAYNSDTQSATRGAFSDAVTNIANHYGLPRINMADDSWYNNFLQDNLIKNHPTAVQLSGLAVCYERLYSKCVEDNYSYFSDYNGSSF